MRLRKPKSGVSKIDVSAKGMTMLFYSREFARYELIIPNVYMDFWAEMDIFGLRRSGYVDEIEIKLTAYDYRKDFKKTVTVDLGGPLKGIHRYVQRLKHDEIKAGRGQANRFSFFVPEELVGKIVIPEYAGLYVLKHNGNVSEVKRAALMHREKMSVEKKYKMARKICFRYWDMKKEKTHG